MFPILYENSHWLAINKTAGILVEHSKHGFPSVQDTVFEYLSKNEKRPFVGIIHRLDRPTSGVLLLAKKKNALKLFNEQFRLRKIRKSYLAIVENPPPNASGKLQHWLKKDSKNHKALIFQQPEKEAIECLLTYRLLEKNDRGYLLEILPKTGKYHQIRAQLSAIGCPIIGDEKYGATTNFHENAVALHAWKLKGKDPINGENFDLKADWDILVKSI